MQSKILIEKDLRIKDKPEIEMFFVKVEVIRKQKEVKTHMSGKEVTQVLVLICAFNGLILLYGLALATMSHSALSSINAMGGSSL